MDRKYAWINFGVVVFISAFIYATHAQTQEDFVSELECPFFCECVDYAVNCTNIDVFPDDIPKGTEKLFISDSVLDYIPMNAFLDLVNLTEIHFTASSIKKLRACSFAELENLTMISFKNTKIELIEGNAFSNLENISNFRFYSSSIGEMSSFAFHHLRGIERMEFFWTNISTIHPHAFLDIDEIDEFGFLDATIQRFLRDGFSKFGRVEEMYLSNTTIPEWQCGSTEAIGNATVSQSTFTCDCSLAWLWTKNSNPTIISKMNTCSGTGVTLYSMDINKVCPSEKSRDTGCPPLRPFTPHSCSRIFDSPKIPLEKVTYPNFFSRDSGRSSSTSLAPWRNGILLTVVLAELLSRLLDY